jgi:hypothetical protein
MSRQFKSRHGHVTADPEASPAEPVVLDDSNSDVDQWQPDVRVPRQLNARHFARAESTPLDVDFDQLDQEAATNGR